MFSGGGSGLGSVGGSVQVRDGIELKVLVPGGYILGVGAGISATGSSVKPPIPAIIPPIPSGASTATSRRQTKAPSTIF